MCIATTSLVIGSPSNSLVCKCFLHPSPISDGFNLVHGIFIIETLQTALSGADVYYWFVSGYGNLNHLASPYAMPFDIPIIGAVVSLSVQFFFVYRIWVLSGKTSWFICLIICLVSLS
jgi:hypothetical protein